MKVEATAARTRHTITVTDGTEIFFRTGGPASRSSSATASPLNSDAWEDQMVFLAARGYRCIAHDRRGHGRSSQPWIGNDVDTYAADLAALVEELDLHDAVHVAHSTGAGEVARYIGRQGTSRVAKVVLVGAVTPLMLKTAKNPAGLPIDRRMRAGVMASVADHQGLSVPFYGAIDERDGVTSILDAFWLQGMQAERSRHLRSQASGFLAVFSISGVTAPTRTTFATREVPWRPMYRATSPAPVEWRRGRRRADRVPRRAPRDRRHRCRVIADPRLARASVAASIVRNAAVPRAARNTIWSSHASLFNGEPWLKTIAGRPPILEEDFGAIVTVMV